MQSTFYPNSFSLITIKNIAQSIVIQLYESININEFQAFTGINGLIAVYLKELYKHSDCY
jgi:hypothetical protein